MIIAVQAVAAVICHVKIGPAIIVEISNRAAVTPPVVFYPCAFRHVGKGAIVVIVKQSRVRRGGLACKSVISGTIDKIYVQPAIIVIVKQTYARPLGLKNQPLLRGARLVMPACQARGCRDILEDDRAVLHEPAGSNRAMLTVELRLLGPRIRHPAARRRFWCTLRWRDGRGFGFVGLRMCLQGKAPHARKNKKQEKDPRGSSSLLKVAARSCLAARNQIAPHSISPLD